MKTAGLEDVEPHLGFDGVQREANGHGAYDVEDDDYREEGYSSADRFGHGHVCCPPTWVIAGLDADRPFMAQHDQDP